MRNPNTNHPWRKISPSAFTVDPIANSRSGQFAAYLETLPREERQRIVAAERVFVSRFNLGTSRQQSTARSYAGSMLGVKENEPVAYRGFLA